MAQLKTHCVFSHGNNYSRPKVSKRRYRGTRLMPKSREAALRPLQGVHHLVAIAVTGYGQAHDAAGVRNDTPYSAWRPILLERGAAHSRKASGGRTVAPLCSKANSASQRQPTKDRPASPKKSRRAAWLRKVRQPSLSVRAVLSRNSTSSWLRASSAAARLASRRCCTCCSATVRRILSSPNDTAYADNRRRRRGARRAGTSALRAPYATRIVLRSPSGKAQIRRHNSRPSIPGKSQSSTIKGKNCLWHSA